MDFLQKVSSVCKYLSRAICVFSCYRYRLLGAVSDMLFVSCKFLLLRKGINAFLIETCNRQHCIPWPKTRWLECYKMLQNLVVQLISANSIIIHQFFSKVAMNWIRDLFQTCCMCHQACKILLHIWRLKDDIWQQLSIGSRKIFTSLWS